MNTDNLFGEMIYAYTREQAIDDGELVDVTDIAKEAGFTISVAVTRTVWDQYVAWTDEDTKRQTAQDESGRLWDVIWMLRMATRNNREKNEILYRLYVVPRGGRARKPVKMVLKAVISGGDNGEPVITIMLPSED